MTAYATDEQIIYKCNTPGYELINGSLTLTCKSSGSWSHSVPTCSRLFYPLPFFHLVISFSASYLMRRPWIKCLWLLRAEFDRLFE